MEHHRSDNAPENSRNRFVRWIRVVSRRRFRLWRSSVRRWDAKQGQELRDKARETSEHVTVRAREHLDELKTDSRERYDKARPHLERAAQETRERAVRTWRLSVKWMRITASVVVSAALFAAIAAIVFFAVRSTGADATDLTCDGCPIVDVIRIIDGDTLDTGFGRVRIYGADTPEHGQRCFNEATAEMRRLAGDKIRVQQGPRQIDVFDRNLFYAYTESGNSIDELLISNGLAVAWTADGQHRDHLVDAETSARRSRVGCLWE